MGSPAAPTRRRRRRVLLDTFLPWHSSAETVRRDWREKPRYGDGIFFRGEQRDATPRFNRAARSFRSEFSCQLFVARESFAHAAPFRQIKQRCDSAELRTR